MPVSRARATIALSQLQSLRVPQARVLRALLPADPEAPPMDWPLLTRAQLGLRAGFTAVSGSCTRALNGVREGSSSGPAQMGLLLVGVGGQPGMGYVEVESLEVEGVKEDNYRITPAGVRALSAWLERGGELPPLKDASVCTNRRYQE